MNSFARLVSGRRSKFARARALDRCSLAALGPLAGKFESAQKNEPSSFLPGRRRVGARCSTPPTGSRPAQATPAIVVFGAPDGLRRAHDRAAVADACGRLAASPTSRASSSVTPAAVLRGRRGRAPRRLRSSPDGDEEVLIDAVERIREIAVARTSRPASRRRSPGRPGFSADASKAFEGINSTLLFATAGLVFVLLVLIYRSPIFWVLPLLAVFLAEGVVRGLGYAARSSGRRHQRADGRHPPRPRLRCRHRLRAPPHRALPRGAPPRRGQARGDADRGAAGRPAILASAGTVVAALLCLSFAQVNSTAGLGPVGAMGVAVAAIAMLTVLPALLLIGGRRAFWPFVPRCRRPRNGRLAARTLASPRRRGSSAGIGAVWIVTTLALGRDGARHAHARRRT